MPENWVWTRLGDIAFYKKGPFGSSITKSMFVPKSDETVKVYEQKNAISKDATLGNYYISQDKFEELKGFEVFPGDIIVSCAGTIGETYVLPPHIETGIINQALMRIKLYDNEIVDFYLLYFDFILKNQAKEQGNGTAMKNIPPFDILKEYLIPLPPLGEQERIISFLKRINSFINNIENNKNDITAFIKQAKSKVLNLAIRGKLVPQDSTDEPASVLLERIRAKKEMQKRSSDISHYPFEVPESWVWSHLCDIGEIITGNTPSKNNKEYYGEDYPFYKPSDLELGIGVEKSTDNLSSRGYEISKKLPKKSILVTSIGATIGKTGLILREGTCNQQINAIVPNKDIQPPYIYYVCISDFFQEQIRRNASATTLPIINKNKFSFLNIPIPPTEEQRRIIMKIQDIFNLFDTIALLIEA